MKLKENYNEKLQNEIDKIKKDCEKEKNEFVINKEKEFNMKIETYKNDIKKERDEKLNNVIKQLTEDMELIGENRRK